MTTPYAALPTPSDMSGPPQGGGGQDPARRRRRRMVDYFTTWAIVIIVLGGGVLVALSLHARHIAQSGMPGTFVAAATDECHTVHHTSTSHSGHHTTHHTTTSQSCTWTGPFDSDDGAVHIDTAYIMGKSRPADHQTMHVYKLEGNEVATATGGSVPAIVLRIVVPLLLLAGVIVGRVRWGRRQL